MSVRCSILSLSLLLAVSAHAQRVTGPSLQVTEGAAPSSLRISQLDVEARIVGHLAETSMTLTFANPFDRVLAGDLTFPLPAGSTVSGYALDIDGVLVDGVIVEKQRARQIFEAEVRKGVDPGLVEQVAGAAWRTRVFPIPAHGSRTVRVSYLSEITTDTSGARFLIPLGFTTPIEDVHLRVEVARSAERPLVAAKGPVGLRFEPWKDAWVAEARARSVVLDRPVEIELPALHREPVAVEIGHDGQVHFAIHDRFAVPAGAARIEPARIGILWDVSASQAQADVERELRILRRWLDARIPFRIAADVILFSNRAEAPRHFDLPRDLEPMFRMLREASRDGATNLGALTAAARSSPAELYLLVGDGISNFGDPELPRFPAPLFVLDGASVANHDALRAMALASGGAWIDLARLGDEAAAEMIGQAPFAFREASTTGGSIGECYPRIAEPVTGDFSLAGVLESDRATVTLHLAGASGEVVTRSYEIQASGASEGDLLRRFWAQKKVADLAVGGTRNDAAILEVGKAHGLVTAGTSLLVLERLEQYLEHGIRPPASLPTVRAAWDREIASRDGAKKAAKTEKLDRILSLWNERVAWWEQEFDLNPAPAKAEKESLRRSAERASITGSMAPAESSASERIFDAAADDAPSAGAMAARPAASPAPGGGTKKGKADSDESEPQAPAPTITLKPWNPQTPYLAALAAASVADRERTYLAQRGLWGSSPAFYLDVSDWFAQLGDPVRALRVLSNIAELQLEDAALLRILAHRLAQLDELDLAIGTFERVAALRPDEPQSHRDLALALDRRAAVALAEIGRDPSRRGPALQDAQRALDLLARVVMERWERFDEIELLALVELNRILVRVQGVGAVRVPVDPRLVRALDMDVRIVMSWDADMTDMDLHVREPSGEEAYYGANRTRIGGRVSRDFTQGYGPEEYSIRRAMKGDYAVMTKFFGSSAATLQGAVTLHVDVFTDYGRATEQQQSLTLRLTDSKETFTVGTIRFEGAGKKPAAVTRGG